MIWGPTLQSMRKRGCCTLKGSPLWVRIEVAIVQGVTARPGIGPEGWWSRRWDQGSSWSPSSLNPLSFSRRDGGENWCQRKSGPLVRESVGEEIAIPSLSLARDQIVAGAVGVLGMRIKLTSCGGEFEGH